MKPFIISWNTFPFDCIIGLWTKWELLRFCSKYFTKKELENCKKYLEDMKVARFLHLWSRSIIFFPTFKNNPSCVATLMHELLHYTFFAMDTAWIPYTEDSEEAFTYFFENISRQVFEKVVFEK